jgi:hypothetical protein
LRTIDDLEYATMQRIDWFNNRRMRSQLDYVHPRRAKAPTTLIPRRPGGDASTMKPPSNRDG